MTKRIILIAIILFAIAFTAIACTVAADTQGETHHWLLYNTDDAYILCADGQYTITVNGADSLYIRCHPIGAAEVDK